MNAQMVSAALAFPLAVRATEVPVDAELKSLPAVDISAGPAGLCSRSVRPQSWARKWRMEHCVPRLARLHARTRLGMMAWTGDQSASVRVITEVVRNAVQHVGAGTVELTLTVDEQNELVIDVTDPSPGDDLLGQALTGREGSGLWLVRHLGGEVSWFPTESGNGKTVRIQMRPSVLRPTPPIVEAP